MTFQRLQPAHPVRALALAAAMFCLLSAAQAETSPYYIGARATVTRDSNVDRTPEPVSDTIVRTGIFGGLDQPIGRQRLRANLSADWNRYQNEDRLNHTEGSGLVRLDWETVGNLSGDLQLSHSQSLYRDLLQSDELTQKTIGKTTDAQFNARLGVVTAWTLEAGAFGSRTRYDTQPRNLSNLDYNGYRAAVRYGASSLLSVSLGARHATGEYPNLAEGRQDFTRKDIDLIVDWRPTGSSNLSGWVSRSRLNYETAMERSTTLTTGGLTYRYRPGGRLSLDVGFKRDSNAGQYAFDSQLGPFTMNNQGTEARLTNTTSLSGNYEVTGKIKLGLDLRYADRQLDNAITRTTLFGPTTTVISESDRTKSASLTATYDATRALRFSCGFTRVERSTDSNPQLTYPYAVNLTSCSAQFVLQP
jgi:hypothetical protein